MPGTHLTFGSKGLSDTQLLLAFDDVRSPENIRVTEYYRDGRTSLALSAYDGYPHYIIEDERSIIILEGMVYNFSQSAIRQALASIAADYAECHDYRRAIREFVNESDGDYIVVIFSKEHKEVLVFNDRWARLPSFYCMSDNCFVFSRELKYILHFLDHIVFNRPAIVEFLVFGYTLGDKTFFQDIKRFDPASLISWKPTRDSQKNACERLFTSNFTTLQVGMTRDDTVRRCVTLFLESLLTRVSKASESGLDIVADLSGGYDTRSVFVALSRLGVPFRCCTDCSIADERVTARRVADAYRIGLVEFNANHTGLDIDLARHLTYLTDCMVNYWTTYRCYLDALERGKSLQTPIARFMGFGGEFIRHPFRPKTGYSDLLEMLQDNAFTSFLAIDAACSVLGLRRSDFFENLKAEISAFPESTTADKVKHLYFEYYNKMVNGGENRHRLFGWTVQPLWGKDLFTFEMTAIPPAWVSFRFYNDFLLALDPKSLEVPLYGSNFSLHTSFARVCFTFIKEIRSRMADQRHFLKAKRNLYAGLTKFTKISPPDSWSIMNIRNALKADGPLLTLIDADAVNSFLETRPRGPQLQQLLTLILYIEAIQDKFRDNLAY
jgi:asparagine synthase (glutamine-hydrolysing)